MDQGIGNLIYNGTIQFSHFTEYLEVNAFSAGLGKIPDHTGESIKDLFEGNHPQTHGCILQLGCYPVQLEQHVFLLRVFTHIGYLHNLSSANYKFTHQIDKLVQTFRFNPYQSLTPVMAGWNGFGLDCCRSLIGLSHRFRLLSDTNYFLTVS